MKYTSKIISIILVIVIALSLCSCGKSVGTTAGKTENGKNVWYLGGDNIGVGDVDVEALFANTPDSVDADKIYSSIEYTPDMLCGVYTLNNKEKDFKTVRKEIPFMDVEDDGETYSLSSLPTSVYIGAKNVCCEGTLYDYSEYSSVTDIDVAVIEFATPDDIVFTLCIYTIEGNTITFKPIITTSEEDEPLEYEFAGNEFKYEFQISGPYITFKKDGSSLKLKSYCFTENADDELWLTGYSLPDSPLIGDLDYFSSSNTFNYAVKRDGTYYDLSAYKMTEDGLFTAYLADIDMLSKERTETIKQYAYIVQSSTSFMNDFSILLLDGDKKYYYTDTITEREARVLKDDGADISKLTDDQIKEIAEKKSNLFDDLSKEFENQGINVTINRSTGEIAMDASVLFGGDSAEITADGKALLNKFLAAYTTIAYNEKYDGFISKTLVEGHTAPVAGSTYESGLSLSTQRADNVKNYCLSSDTGVDTSKLTSTLEAVGLSNSKPIYGSDGEIDMAACRRVSFRFIVNLDAQ